MDGFSSIFLSDVSLFSGLGDSPATNILYVEDFDEESELTPGSQNGAAEESLSLVTLTQEDVDVAKREGQAEGMRAALADATLVQAQLHDAVMQNLADALMATRNGFERIITRQAAEGARAILAILQAAIPATMTRNVQVEIEAVLQAVLPALACEPELRVRTHPDVSDDIRETLAGRLPADYGILSVIADPELTLGDVQIVWRNGEAGRDSAAIWNEIRAALNPLGLPSMQEICRGNGC